MANGPVLLTKNGYGASVLVSISMFDKLMATQHLYSDIAQSEEEIDRGHGIDAKKSLSAMRKRLHVARRKKKCE